MSFLISRTLMASNSLLVKDEQIMRILSTTPTLIQGSQQTFFRSTSRSSNDCSLFSILNDQIILIQMFRAMVNFFDVPCNLKVLLGRRLILRFLSLLLITIFLMLLFPGRAGGLEQHVMPRRVRRIHKNICYHSRNDRPQNLQKIYISFYVFWFAARFGPNIGQFPQTNLTTVPLCARSSKWV